MCYVFEPLVLKEHFDINYIRSMMITYGAYGAQMTGSGSAVFGIYDSFESVSYTHLDVYKRQMLTVGTVENVALVCPMSFVFSGSCRVKVYSVPVSYTHLDVYKRQNTARASTCFVMRLKATICRTTFCTAKRRRSPTRSVTRWWTI